MESVPTFLQSVEVRTRKSRHPGQPLIRTFEFVMQEKHELETTHKNIVLRGLNPFIGKKALQSSKPLSRSKEFIVKKVHHINCPTVPRKKSLHIPEIPEEKFEPMVLMSDDEDFDMSLTQPQMPSADKGSYTCIFYAEDLFGANKNNFNSPKILLSSPKTSKIPARANLNNPYIRKIAGWSISPPIKGYREVSEDPLENAESKLPTKLRSVTKASPWVYSSVLRTNRIFKVKCKSRH